jgi:hypothetical protein
MQNSDWKEFWKLLDEYIRCEYDGEEEDITFAAYTKMRQHAQYLSNCPDELKLYFTSGNNVPVTRATILAKDFWRIIGEEPPWNN